MDLIKEKFTKYYFLQKIGLIVNGHFEKRNLPLIHKVDILSLIEKFVDDNDIISSALWCYGTGLLDNGVRKLQATNTDSFLLLTLFTLRYDQLRFYFLQVSYTSPSIVHHYEPFDLPLNRIDRLTYSSNGDLGIVSELFDHPLLIKMDSAKHARFFSGTIDALKNNPPQKIETRKTKTVAQLADDVLLALLKNPQQKGYLKELDIDIDESVVPEVANYIDDQGFARVGLSKDSCFFELKHHGRNHIEVLEDVTTKYAPKIIPLPPIKKENLFVKAKKYVKQVFSAPPKAIWQIMIIMIALLGLIFTIFRSSPK